MVFFEEVGLVDWRVWVVFTLIQVVHQGATQLRLHSWGVLVGEVDRHGESSEERVIALGGGVWDSHELVVFELEVDALKVFCQGHESINST